MLDSIGVMIEDWYNPELCGAWIDEMGKYGDLPRQVFSLPIVLGLARTLSAKRPILSGLMKKSIFELTEKLGGETINYKCTTGDAPLYGLKCLDLGCGEGYLGRYLSEFGVNYLGLDGSPHLIRSANKHKKSKHLKQR